ncbi:MAG: TIGR01458 family HAD-type hydrolase [Acidimicrobiales bacterium]
MEVHGLMIDIDGVLTVSWEPIPGAPETFAELQRRKIPFRLATNTTSRPRREVAELLHTAGFDVEQQQILTAPIATASYLHEHHPDARCFMLSSGDVSEDLDDIHCVEIGDGADVVVLGGAGLVYTHEQLNHAFELLLDGAHFVAMHRNLYWRTARGMELDTGAYVSALEAATGRSPVVIGKPAEAFFRAGLAALEAMPSEVVMVGDDVVNDIDGAQEIGIVGCLVQTGKYRADAVEMASSTPDHVIPSFAHIFDVLDRGVDSQ